MTRRPCTGSSPGKPPVPSHRARCRFPALGRARCGGFGADAVLFATGRIGNSWGYKLDELAFDPNVNLAYYRDGSREWVSVSGTAIVTQDRRLIQLYQKDWKAWFGDQAERGTAAPTTPGSR